MSNPTVRLSKRLLPFAYEFRGSKFTGEFVSPSAMEKVDWAELGPGKTGIYIAQPHLAFRAQKLCSRAQMIGLVFEEFRVGVLCQLVGDGNLPVCIEDELSLGEVSTCTIDRQLSAKVRNTTDVAIKFKLWFSGIVAE